MSPRVALVTGASGAIGPSVVAALSKTHDIRTFSRQPPPAGLFPSRVTTLTGDVSDANALRCAARGADVIVHLAALLHIVDPPAALRAEYERVNVAGTSAVMEAALAEGVSRVVLMSTIAVYGYATQSRLDEDSPVHPDTFYGQTKLSAERVAIAARRDDGSPLATVLRAAAVYGPRMQGNYDRLVRAVARRRFIPIGPGENLRALIFDRDLAAATALAATHPAAGGRVYNVSDGTPHSLREIIAAISQALGRRPPRWYAPVPPVRLALRAASFIDPRWSRMLEKYLEEVVVDASRIQMELGFRPETKLVDGWWATVGEMRRTGRL